MLKVEQKKAAISSVRCHEKDTGSPQVQIALLSDRINDISGHLKNCPKDHSTRRGLMKLVGRRNRILKYLRRRDANAYQQLIDKLDLRR